MKVVIQRSKEASVTVNENIVGIISKGLVVLVGFTIGDTEKEIDYMVNKILNLRIFDDENGVMNKSILEYGGNILSISQFTLYADTSHGRRPSYTNALNAKEASNLYSLFNKKLSEYIHVETGVFQAKMEVKLINDGPITIIIESRD